MLDKKTFAQKPNGFEPGGIQKRLSQTEIEIEELAILMSNGATFKPALLNGTKSKDWLSQQIFALDFDEGTTILCELKRCIELNINPVFGYKTFSYTEDKEKFRLVFCNNEIITDIDIRNDFQKLLIELFPNSDNVTFDPTRLFFGGIGLIECDFDNRINIDNILNKYNDMLNDLKNNDMEIKNKSSNSGASRKGVLHNNDIIDIPILSSTPKTPNSNSDIYTIKAISNRDIKYLIEKYGSSDKKIFETNQEFIDYIRKKINLGELLEFHYPSSIKCIFHDDNNNSAGIFQADDGAWIYKCFGCNVTYNIVGVIERLANFQSRPRTYKFIKDMFNLEIMETEWQKEQKEILFENLNILNDGEFEINCPQANKNIKGIKHYLEKLILIAMNNVHNENLTDKDGQVVFFASANYICKQMGISPNSINKIYQKLVVLTYHKLLNKLDDKELPERFLKRAMAININSDKNNHVNFFSIPSFTVNNSPEIEQRGKQWKENHYTMKGVSREMFYRAEGLEVANKLYPQYKKVTENVDGTYQVVDRTTTKKSDVRTNNIVKVIHELIDEYGYATERKIVISLKDKYKYITTEIQIKKSLKEICDLYGLKRIRANKIIKEQYNINSNGYPFIICKEDI